MNWQDLTDDFQIDVIEGEHETLLLEPGVQKVAELVDRFFKRTD